MKQKGRFLYYMKSAMEQVKCFVPLAEEQLNLDPVIVFRRLIKLESLP